MPINIEKIIISGDMMCDIGQVLHSMICYYAGDARRINHFLKVYGFAKSIGENEGLTAPEQSILEIAAVTHDIGIKNSEIKYNSSAGSYQEIEGPPEARIMLEALGFNAPLIDRVCWLIAHHHTYGNMTERDHIILVEADFIVNAYEDSMSSAAIQSMQKNVFRTVTGKKYLELLYAQR
jgi:HD superfamily phosphodiesterase